MGLLGSPCQWGSEISNRITLSLWWLDTKFLQELHIYNLTFSSLSPSLKISAYRWASHFLTVSITYSYPIFSSSALLSNPSPEVDSRTSCFHNGDSEHHTPPPHLLPFSPTASTSGSQQFFNPIQMQSIEPPPFHPLQTPYVLLPSLPSFNSTAQSDNLTPSPSRNPASLIHSSLHSAS